MNRRASVAFALATVATAVGVLALTPSEAETVHPVLYATDYPVYRDAQAMFQAAAVVVRGRVIGQPYVARVGVGKNATSTAGSPAASIDKNADFLSEGASFVYTVRDFLVTEVYKGGENVKGGLLEVKQMGGVLDGVEYREENARALASEGEYVLFLATFNDIPASLLNPEQGQYVVLSDGTLAAVDGNPVALTLSRLRDLANS